MDDKYDIIVVGSGLGGLECGVILSKEGYNVCVVEQSAIFGGCLQSFQRCGRLIDTGIHHVGSMNEGGIMRQYLKYFGIMDSLNVIELDNDFDVVTLGESGQFCHRGGYERFIEELSQRFPDQRRGIERYCDTIREIGNTINIDVHKEGFLSTNSIDYMSVSAVKFIEEYISDPLLCNIISSSNVLCGSRADSANLYHHAMIHHSNIEGAYRFVGGTQQIADRLCDQIKANGGQVINRAKVVKFVMESDKVSCIELESGDRLFADRFISNLHPATTFSMVEQTPLIKKAYRTRLSLLPNTYGIFTVNLCMKPSSFPYINKNLYFYRGDNVWDMLMTKEEMEVKTVLMVSQLSPQYMQSQVQYSDVVSLLVPIDFSVFEPFKDSRFGARGDEYNELKESITQSILAFTSSHYPALMEHVEAIYASTPLTYQHYTSTPQGSAYGLVKSCQNSLITLIPPRTKINNLLLTGQSVNVHGALGVTLTAAATCGEIIGTQYLAKKVGGC